MATEIKSGKTKTIEMLIEDTESLINTAKKYSGVWHLDNTIKIIISHYEEKIVELKKLLKRINNKE